MSFLTGGTALPTTKADTQLAAIRVSRTTMFEAMAKLPEMSDIVFAARRRRLLESG